MVPCVNCNQEVYKTPKNKGENKFCSVKCHNEFQSRFKHSFTCKICSKDFKWSPSRIQNNNPTYCSIPCRNKCPDWLYNASVQGNIKQINLKGPNRLERAGYKLLEDMNIPYESQIVIAGKFTVDTLLPDCNIIIQWDGDYWHGFRAENDNRPLDPRQLKRKNLDKSQDAYMLKCGYNILRFWEHEVYKEQEKVCETIRRAVESITP